ncbi:MAG: MFS transporter [Proteobacteria bacterium]|nr:MFS transporter [Pseudomonadota bacterium]
MTPLDAAAPAGLAPGPLEARHRRSAAFRQASDPTRVTRAHWHIAIANGLGWMFDGMDGVILVLLAPLIIKDFALDLPTWRTGSQIALLVGISGMYLWPWLADRYGRRTLLALNIAMFSVLMPALALAPSFAVFTAIRCAVHFALNGEWALGTMLVAETWPARLRGRVISINRGTWCFGASAAGGIATVVAAQYGWRAACLVPAVIALLAIYVRAGCPESPLWVRVQDRKRRIAEARAAGVPLPQEDADWARTASRPPLSQVFAAGMWRNTLIATFVGCCCTIIYGTVAGWMPLYLARERHWSTAEYGAFYIWWGLVGVIGLIVSGWISDRFGRRPAFFVMLAQGALFITLWIYARSDTALWVFGLLWSIGYLGFWGPAMTLSAEIFPTRVRGAANGVAWSIAWLVGFVLWPFVTVWLEQRTGSFTASFLVCPVAMGVLALFVWLYVPEHARQDLDEIAT